jgi:hypothetical protein
VPPNEPKPVFAPGLYETESGNSAFPDQTVKSRTCIASSGYDAFRDETMTQYQKSPQFVTDCRLSDTRPNNADVYTIRPELDHVVQVRDRPSYSPLPA